MIRRQPAATALAITLLAGVACLPAPPAWPRRRHLPERRLNCAMPLASNGPRTRFSCADGIGPTRARRVAKL